MRDHVRSGGSSRCTGNTSQMPSQYPGTRSDPAGAGCRGQAGLRNLIAASPSGNPCAVTVRLECMRMPHTMWSRHFQLFPSCRTIYEEEQSSDREFSLAVAHGIYRPAAFAIRDSMKEVLRNFSGQPNGIFDFVNPIFQILCRSATLFGLL